MEVPVRQVRAVYKPETLIVYQAVPVPVALAAARAGKFVPPYKRDDIMWIRPSFLWMMYRCQWATAVGQERVLEVEMTREGFEWALTHSCLAQYDHAYYGDRETWAAALRSSQVRVQWEPERSLQLTPLPQRSLQVGIGVEVIDRYVNEWTVDVNDITHQVRRIAEHVRRGDDHRAGSMLPDERPYPLPRALAKSLHISI